MLIRLLAAILLTLATAIPGLAQRPASAPTPRTCTLCTARGYYTLCPERDVLAFGRLRGVLREIALLRGERIGFRGGLETEELGRLEGQMQTLILLLATRGGCGCNPYGGGQVSPYGLYGNPYILEEPYGLEGFAGPLGSPGCPSGRCPLPYAGATGQSYGTPPRLTAPTPGPGGGWPRQIPPGAPGGAGNRAAGVVTFTTQR